MDSDPGALQERIDAATGRLLADVGALTDDQVSDRSLLPGWSRGHVLTHIARNADGLRNLLAWARTGIETRQYPSRQAREADIAAGAGRTAAELAADLEESAARFASDAASMPESAWATEVQDMLGAAHPAWFVLFRRLTEIEVHHVDAGLGYRPADWPQPFVTDLLERVLGDFAVRADVASCVLKGTDTGRSLRTGPEPEADEAVMIVSGPERDLLAWLIGRAAGTGLSVTGAGHPDADDDDRPPRLPAWR
jgi:maleylpyruvate isomerase